MDLNKKFTPETWPDNPEKATLEAKNKFVGFWLFLGGETILFATLFATYLALKNKGPSGMEHTTQSLYQLPLVFVMTMLLLTSSLTSVFAMYHMKNYNFKKMQLWLAITAFLGLGFLMLEVYEFYHYVQEGFTFGSSAFSSSFYSLVGAHGFHVAIGLVWITLLIYRNSKRGLNLYNATKYYTFSLYWHFIDVVWVFIFTVVYLMGVIG
ncbi:cytochrome c oxidase subunit 3 [Sporosarcina siberiensis]|uniref:Cytochrome c oxidase subunit 3 n=1 Tax=Sporosarcina siberiensis TaxID=1365606 RepID=A0ABW4SHF1_9BACL